MASKVKAPIKPPSTELSSPMMAFCTVFDSDRSTTRSNGFNCASSRFPKMRKTITRKKYTMIGRNIFSAGDSDNCNMSCQRLLPVSQIVDIVLPFLGGQYSATPLYMWCSGATIIPLHSAHCLKLLPGDVTGGMDVEKKRCLCTGLDGYRIMA